MSFSTERFEFKRARFLQMVYCSLRRWSARQALHAAAERRAEIISQYDIGVRDVRPSLARSPIWANNPYRLLIDAVIGSTPSDLDPRV